MKIRAIDTNSDWMFGKGIQSYALDNNAIGENIKTRIMCFYKDCWFDQNSGIDWFRLLGSKGTQGEIELTIRGIILQSYGVVRIDSLSVSSDSIERSLSVQYVIDTIYSQNYSNTVEVV